MNNKDIARILWETSDLMEIAGEDSFRIRSYRNGATAVEGEIESISAILRDPERKVTDIPGIGKGLAFVVKEIDETGTCERHQELLKRFPKSCPGISEDSGVRAEGSRDGFPALPGHHHGRTGEALPGQKDSPTAADGRQAGKGKFFAPSPNIRNEQADFI